MINRIKNSLTNPVFAGLIAIFCCALWGSAFPAIKTGYAILGIQADDYFSQILFAGIRFTLAGVLTIFIGSALAKKPLSVKGKSSFKNVAILSLFQTILQYLLFYVGLARTTGTKGSILTSSSVFFAVIIASVILKQERLTAKKLVGAVIGFAGVVLINLRTGDVSSSFSLMGEGFMILSALSYAVSSVLIKSFSKSNNPVALSGYQFVLGGIVMTVTGLVFGGKVGFNSVQAVLILIYLALLSAIAYTLWGVLLKYNDVSKIAVYSFMTPVFGCLLSALFLHESLAGNLVKTLVSLALVCTGISLVNFKEKNNFREKKYES